MRANTTLTRSTESLQGIFDQPLCLLPRRPAMLENRRVGDDGGEAGIGRLLRNGMSWDLAKVHDIDISECVYPTIL
jgi:hypothetical protein